MATPTQLAALAAVVPLAQNSAKQWDVPASVTLAQWIVESSWGTSELAVQANNYFGIKHSQLNACETYMEFPTAEYEDGKRVIVEAMFVKFGSGQGSFDCHGRLLSTAARYRQAMLSAEHPYVFAVDLQTAGYSTSPSYAASLITLIRIYGLLKYDLPLGQTTQTALAAPVEETK